MNTALAQPIPYDTYHASPVSTQVALALIFGAAVALIAWMNATVSPADASGDTVGTTLAIGDRVEVRDQPGRWIVTGIDRSDLPVQLVAEPESGARWAKAMVTFDLVERVVPA